LFGENDCVIAGRERERVVLKNSVEVAPRDTYLDFCCGGAPEAEENLRATLTGMPVAAVHLSYLTPSVRRLDLDKGSNRGCALA
jgi:hypothetical protein